MNKSTAIYYEPHKDQAEMELQKVEMICKDFFCLKHFVEHDFTALGECTHNIENL